MWGNDNVRGIALAFFLAVAIKTKSVRTDFFVEAKVRSFLGIAKKIVRFVLVHYSTNSLRVGINAAKNPIAVTMTAVAITSQKRTSTG